MAGLVLSAFTMAQAMRCVYEILLLPFSARCSFTNCRFSSITLTVNTRCEVAVGTDRLAFMFSAMRAATPRKGISCSAGPRAMAGVGFAGS